jgi:hypothetical protein
MIKLSDAELDQVFRAAQPLPVGDRDEFLKQVAARLSGLTDISDGVVYRTCLEVQRKLMDYPTIGSGHWARYR